MQVLTEKNTRLSQELEECKTQLKAAVAKQEESKKASSGNTCLDNYKDVYQLSIRHGLVI